MVNVLAIILVIVGSLVGSYGMYVFKKGANNHAFFELFATKYFWWGAALNAISIPFYIIALGLEHLSFIYPLVSINYIWTTFLSVKYLGENMNRWKYVALVGVVVGIVLIGIGS